jgi:transposase
MKTLQLVEQPRKRGRPLTYEEKWLVFHVFKTFLKGKQDQEIIQIEDPYDLTSQYTGVGRSIVANIAKSVRDTGTVPPSISPGNRRQPTAIPSLVEGRLREFVFEQHRQGAVCNATHLRAFLQDEFGITVHDRTVRRHLNRMGFWWIRTKNKPRSLREKAEIRQQRHDYLYELRQNRQLGVAERYRVVYLDESFLHHHHGAQFSWFSEGDFVERSCGKGRRWCFIHAMQKEGLIDGAFFIFEAKKGTGDYHKQFDGALFQRWFTEQLLPQLPSRCLIVLDRCRFHRVAKDSLLPHQMRKAELREWLTERGLHWEEKWLRARLIEEVDKHRDKKPMVEVFAEEQGHKVLFLPVHHPELNPIELVWATAKNHCGAVFSNHTNFQAQRHHLEESFKRDITPEYCVKLYDHVHQIEEKYWDADLAIDDELESTQEDSDLFCETI